VETGYDPRRIRELSWRTREALESLRAVRSPDPLAADALRASRLARQNLEDLWLPAVRAIERSDAMVTWTNARLAPLGFGGTVRQPIGPPHPPRGSPRSRSLEALSDDELFGRLQWTDRVMADPTGSRRASGIHDHSVTAADLDELAAELAARAHVDPRLGRRLVAAAPTTVLIGHLLDRASFPAPLIVEVATAMMWPHGPRAARNLDEYAEALSATLRALTEHPADCLVLLLDPAALYGVAAWDALDADVVADVVATGLHRAVADDPDRLRDGYGVLARLVQLANGPLDRGFAPGMARGIAAATAGYVDTLAPAITTTSGGPVVVSNERRSLSVDLGSYDEVAALMGAVLRDAEAAARLGVVVGAYADHVLTGLGPDVLTRPGLASVVSFTLLVEDAARTEQSQLVVEAAAREAQRRRLGSVIGFGITAALSASGVGVLGRAAVAQVTRAATDALARVEPGRLPHGSIGAQMYTQVTLSTVAAAVADPHVLRASGAAPLNRAQAAGLARRLEAIDRCDDPVEQTRLVSELEQYVDQRLPRLGGHLDAVRAHGQLDQLR
jgi:hypothetical protein